MLGEPPSYRAIADARSDQATIGWNVLVNDKPVGSAVSTAVKTADGSTEIQSRVHFDYLPVEEMAPRGLREIVGPVVAPQAGRVPMDCRSTLTVDREGRLTSFRSALDMQSVRNVVRLDGQVDGGQLTLTIRTTDFSYTTDAYVPPNSLAGDALSPQACLPGLAPGADLDGPLLQPRAPLDASASHGNPHGDRRGQGADRLERQARGGLAGGLSRRFGAGHRQRQDPAEPALGPPRRHRVAPAGHGVCLQVDL